MHDKKDQFYGPIGEALKAWWVTVEKYGFHNLLEDHLRTITDDNGKHEDLLNEDCAVCIEDPFVNVDPSNIDVISEGDEKLHGFCIVKLKSGHVLSGNFVKGRRKGPGFLSGPALESIGIRNIWGHYKHGVLTGPGRVVLLDKNETTLEGNFVEGKLSGHVKGTSSLTSSMVWVSRFFQGRPYGPCWKTVHGGVFLYCNGSSTIDGKFSGENVAFIYPDFETVFIGKFIDDVMVKTRESRVIGHVIQDGIAYLKFAKPSGDFFSYCPSTNMRITCSLMQQDPYERKCLEVKKSRLSADAGDGLFVKINVPANTTISFYNGIRIKPGEVSPFSETGYQIFIENCHKKVIIPGEFLDIPPSLVSISKYCASLSHKANHSFEPNCRWGTMEHPTFGKVPSLVTLRDIFAGTELTVHYQIDMAEAASTPHAIWYVKLWDEFSHKVSERNRGQ